MYRQKCPNGVRRATITAFFSTRFLVRLSMLALLAVCVPLGGAAQTPFALRALGQNIETDSARDTGRGGWGMAASDSLVPGTCNPAALASLRHLALVISGFGETTSSVGGGLARVTRGAYLPNARLAVPLRAGNLAFHAGLSIQRSMKFDTVEDFQFDHLGRVVQGYDRYTREGSLFSVPLGLSWRLVEALAVGATFNLVRGAVTDKVNQVFTDPIDSYYLPNVSEQKDELSGRNVTLALLWDGMPRLQLGASLTTGYDLGVRRTVSLGGVAEQAEDRFIGAMPPQYRAGIQIKLAGDWRFGADGRFARYSALVGYPSWESAVRDEWTVAAGFERIVSFKEYGRGYVLPLRVGYQQRQWAHAVARSSSAGQPAGDGAVREHAVSVGTGFPFRNRLGFVDLALSYVWIGSEKDNGWRSNSLRLGVSIMGLERLVF